MKMAAIKTFEKNFDDKNRTDGSGRRDSPGSPTILLENPPGQGVGQPAIAAELRGTLPIAPFSSLVVPSTFCRPLFIDIMVLHNYKHPTTSQNHRF